MNAYCLTGEGPRGESRQVTIAMHGADLVVRGMSVETDEIAEARVPVAAFQEASVTTSFTLPAVGGNGEPVQLTFRLKDNNNMVIAIDDWSVEVSMDELRQCLVMLGVLPDSQPQGIQASEVVARRRLDYLHD